MFGLNKKTLALLRGAFKRYPALREVKVYGSRARGDQRPGSDIDLALFFEGEEDISALISWDLEELPLPYMFDVANFKGLAEGRLKREIESEGQRLYVKARLAAPRKERHTPPRPANRKTFKPQSIKGAARASLSSFMQKAAAGNKAQALQGGKGQ